MRTVRSDIRDLNKWSAAAQQSGFRLEALSKSFNVCPRQLRRYTRAIFGCSPQEWLQKQRLLLAGGMLKNRRSVKAVAAALGFKQVSHFSREFKLHYGVSPKTFLAYTENQSPRSHLTPRSLNVRGR